MINLEKEYTQIPYSRILGHFGFQRNQENLSYNHYTSQLYDLIIFRENEVKFNCLDLKTLDELSPYELTIKLAPQSTIHELLTLHATLLDTEVGFNDLNITKTSTRFTLIQSILKLKSLNPSKLNYLSQSQKDILSSNIFHNKILLSDQFLILPLFVKNKIVNFYKTTLNFNSYYNNYFDCNWVSNASGGAKEFLISADLHPVLKYLENKTPDDYIIIIIPPFADLTYIQSIHLYLSKAQAKHISLFAGPNTQNFNLALKFLNLNITQQMPDLYIDSTNYRKAHVTFHSVDKKFKMRFMKLTPSLNNNIRNSLEIEPKMKFQETESFSNNYIFTTTTNKFNKSTKTISFNSNQITNKTFIETIITEFSIDHQFNFIF